MRRTTSDLGLDGVGLDPSRPTEFHADSRAVLRENLSALQVGTRLLVHRRGESVVVDPARVPVLLVPGFLSGDFAFRPMVDQLRAHGHWTGAARITPNTGCTQELAAAVERRLVQISEQRESKVAIVGWSRGGTLGKLVALARPDLVASLVTLGTPTLDPLAVNAALGRQLQLLVRLQAIGVPGVLGQDCLSGDCARQVRGRLTEDLPADLPYLAVFSQSDGVIDWRACLDPAADQLEVDATHMAMGADSAVITLVCQRLQSLDPPVPT